MKSGDCPTGKKKYPGKKMAARDAKTIKFHKKYKGMTPMPYICRTCRHWHVGNSDQAHSK